MPPTGLTCNRCRQVPPAEGDSWCGACLAWESLGRELAGGWDQAGCRTVAADIVVNCTRQIRALRSLGAGLSREHPSAGPGRAVPAGSCRAGEDPPGRSEPSERRASIPRRRSAAPPPPVPRPKAKEEQREGGPEADEEESEEEEERSPDPPLKPGRSDRRDPPPEPDRPPSRRESHRSDHHHSKADTRRSRERTRDRRGHHSGRRGSERTRSGKKTHRAGRKHQRLARLAENPLLRVHRKASEAFLGLASLHSGREHLDRPILALDGRAG